MSNENQTLNQETDKSNSTKSQSYVPRIDLSQNPANKNFVPPTEYDDKYLKSWLRSLTILHHGHWDAARKYERINLRLGLGIAITGAISGTTAFTQLQQQTEQGGLTIWMQIIVGIFAFTAAALGAAQAFMRPSEIAGRHKKAGQKYGTLRREIELNLYLETFADPKNREPLLKDFNARWGAVDEESLPVPQRIYDRTEAEYKKNKSLFGSMHSINQSSYTSTVSNDSGINKN